MLSHTSLVKTNFYIEGKTTLRGSQLIVVALTIQILNDR